MWDNPRRLNLAAGFLVGVAALVFAAAALQALLRSELFPVREVTVHGVLAHTTRAEIERALAGRLAGNFFALDMEAARAALERLPWVRRVALKRVWPDRLEALIEEHVALARWADEALVNTYGERFEAATDAPLPVFIGPAGTEGEIARGYRRFAELLDPLGAPIDRVVLTPRYAWQLRTRGGLNVVLGRDAGAAAARLARFVEAYPGTLGRLARRHDHVDLRYPNGFALRMAELPS